MIEAYPLCWPAGRPRNKYPERSRFSAAFTKARDSIVDEVRLLNGDSVIISTNLALRRDGLPYANLAQPVDRGVAVYFTYKKRQMCFACDRWEKVEENMHAISLTISALRGIARWGTGDMMAAAFTGFAALPAPSNWRAVLNTDENSFHRVQMRYQELARKLHPDRGGSEEEMRKLNEAWRQAANELTEGRQ